MHPQSLLCPPLVLPLAPPPPHNVSRAQRCSSVHRVWPPQQRALSAAACATALHVVAALARSCGAAAGVQRQQAAPAASQRWFTAFFRSSSPCWYTSTPPPPHRRQSYCPYHKAPPQRKCAAVLDKCITRMQSHRTKWAQEVEVLLSCCDGCRLTGGGAGRGQVQCWRARVAGG